LAIGDALAIVASQIRNFTQEDFSKTHPLGSIGKKVLLKVRDIMKSGTDLPIIINDATFKNLIIEISRKALGCIIITNREMNLLGFVTDGDIRRALQSDKDLSEISASDIMTRNPVTIQQDAFLEVAVSLMESRESQINSLVVLDDKKKVVGILRLHDIIRSGI
jgi:arabinose-5-phosphate isomerase